MPDCDQLVERRRMRQELMKCLTIAVLVFCGAALAEDQERIVVSTPFESVDQPLTPEVDDLLERLRLAEAEIESLKNVGTVPSVAGQMAPDTQSSRGPAAADGGGAAGDLASRSQNPVSDLASLPFQSNFNFGSGPDNRTGFVGNLQPVIPVKLNDEWNLINRMILPMVNVPIGSELRSDGLGDSLLQFYFSPRESEELIWGLGPNVLIPTASDSTLGAQQWGAGINGVALLNRKPILTGALISQTWSVDGSTQPFLVQPFFNYNLPKGWFVAASGEINADWALPEDRRWSIPMGAGVGRVLPILGQPVNISTRFAPYLENSPGGPDWQFRLSVTYLFPK